MKANDVYISTVAGSTDVQSVTLIGSNKSEQSFQYDSISEERLGRTRR